MRRITTVVWAFTAAIAIGGAAIALDATRGDAMSSESEFVLVEPADGSVYGVMAAPDGSVTCDARIGETSKIMLGGPWTTRVGEVTATLDTDSIELQIQDPDPATEMVVIINHQLAGTLPIVNIANSQFRLNLENWGGSVKTIILCGGGA